MKIFLIDIGSTYIKYSIYDKIRKETIVADRVRFPDPIVDMNALYEVPENKIRDTIISLFDLAADASCVSAYICVQMHGYLLRNKYGWSNYISWRDQRGNVVDSRLSEIDFYIRGTKNKKNLPVASLCADDIDLHESEFYTLGSYISFILTGNNITHSTDACPSGFYNKDTLEKDDSLFQGLALPDVTGYVRAVGRYKGISVYSPVGDHQTSYLGSDASETSYLLNIGTATQLSTLGPANGNYRESECRPYFTSDVALYTVSGLTGGSVFLDTNNVDELFSQIMEAMKKLPPKESVVISGGGAKYGNDSIKKLVKQIEAYGKSCVINTENIGIKGLLVLSELSHIEAGFMLNEVNFAAIPILAADSGLDFYIADNEHGAFDYSFTSQLLTIARFKKIKTIIRLPDNNRMNIIKFADMGADAFLLPMTNCKADIEKVTKYALYTPLGQRGISTTRAHTMYNPPKLTDYIADANARMKIYAQIETKEGCDNIEEILSTPGVSGIFVGPNDLAASLGCIGKDEQVIPYIEIAIKTAVRTGKKAGIITTNRRFIECALQCGATMVSYGSEVNILKEGLKNIRKMF